VAALDQDGSERPNGEVCEITDRVDLSAWPQGSRLIVRRERAHPGAQLSFTDHDGHRFQAILTDQPDADIAALECRHRARARVEDRIRDDKDTGLAKLPFKAFQLNEVWLQIVMLAHDLIVCTQALLLDGELHRAQPKRLRYRLLHVAARLAFHGRRARLRLQHDWPWATELAAAFGKLKTAAGRHGLTTAAPPHHQHRRRPRPRSSAARRRHDRPPGRSQDALAPRPATRQRPRPTLHTITQPLAAILRRLLHDPG
jgi:hypothetical protein